MTWSLISPKIDHDRVVRAIREAELGTSGEIRVVVARHRADDPVAAAQSYFDTTGMANSPHRNGILIFVAPRSRRFAVIGDTAVHKKCGDSFWTNLTEAMGGYFRGGKFTDGLVHGIERAGELLAATFPRSTSDQAAGPPAVSEVD